MSIHIPNNYKAARYERIWLFIILLLAVVTYLPTFKYLWARWMADVQYSMAWLVPPVALYFVWKKWPEVKLIERSPSNWGLLLIALALLVHVAVMVLDISGPSAISLLICLIGGIIYFHSVAVVKTLSFPLAYLLFMIPVPGGIISLVGLPMQLGASAATASILSNMGIEVYRSGVNLIVDGDTFEVAQACSGMSSMVALVGVSAVFAYLTKLPNVYKWALFLLSLPIALIANIARITTIAIVCYIWGRNVAMNIYHDWSSPLLFMVAVMLLFGVNRGFEWLSVRKVTS